MQPLHPRTYDALQKDAELRQWLYGYIKDRLGPNVGKIYAFEDGDEPTFSRPSGAPRRSPWSKNIFVNLPWILKRRKGREIVARILLTH